MSQWNMLRYAVLRCVHAVLCLQWWLQDSKNRELGAENGKLQRTVLNLEEHERQLTEVRHSLMTVVWQWWILVADCARVLGAASACGMHIMHS